MNYAERDRLLWFFKERLQKQDDLGLITKVKLTWDPNRDPDMILEVLREEK